MTDYPIGATVRYTAHAEVAQDDAGPLTAVGMVNGEPMRNADGVIDYVPVWTNRDHGREPTTIYVDVRNIVEVTP